MSVVEPLALKYRPKKLSQVIGQPVVVKAFTNAFKSNTLHHAYILAGTFGSGKCVAGDSLIFLGNGLDRIDNIVKEKGNKVFIPLKTNVICETGMGKTSAGYFEKDVDTIRIITNEGYSINGTLDHPIRVMSEDGTIEWKKLGEIKEGDYACIFRDVFNEGCKENNVDFNFSIDEYLNDKFGDDERNVICNICGKELGNMAMHIKLHNISNNEYKNRFNVKKITSPVLLKENARRRIKTDIIFPKKVNANLARLLGYIISEGHVAEGSIGFTNSDPVLIQDFVNLVKTLFGLDLKIGHDKRNTVKYVLIHPLLARKFLEKIVGNVKSKDKFVPDVILRSNNDIVKEFLKAYFEGDGYNNVSGASSIGCTSKSYVLMHQIQILLLKFGIVSSLKEKYTKKLSYSDKDYISWQLSIYSTNMEKFKNSIGFISDKKISEINKICCHRKVNPNKDVIPFVQDPLYNFRKSLPVKKNGHIVINNVHISAGPQWPPNCQSYTIKHKTHKCLTYNNLNDIIEYFNKFIRILQKNSYLIDNQYKLDLIKKIKSKIEYCRNIYNKNYFYSKVVSIKQNKSDVYDISKKGDDKSFVANGFINHNTTVARIVAAMENCKQGGKDPCGECSNCKDIFMGKSLEVIELDAGSRGKVDDIRELHKSLYQCPVECKTKYVIIDEAHSLTGSAAEASLKMIEEPPPFVRFILCTTEPDAFKPTIHSRCILWGFKKVLWPELFNHLKMVAGKEGLEYDEHALQIIAKYSKGSVRDSLQHLQKIINYVGKEKITTEATIEALGAINESLYFDLIDGVITNNMIKAFQTVNQLFIDGKEAKIVVDGLYEHLNNLLMVRTCGSEIDKFDFTQEEIKRYNHQNTITSGNVLLKMMNLVGHISFDVEYSLNPSHSFNKFVVESVQVVKSAQLANVKK